MQRCTEALSVVMTVRAHGEELRQAHEEELRQAYEEERRRAREEKWRPARRESGPFFFSLSRRGKKKNEMTSCLSTEMRVYFYFFEFTVTRVKSYPNKISSQIRKI